MPLSGGKVAWDHSGPSEGECDWQLGDHQRVSLCDRERLVSNTSLLRGHGEVEEEEKQEEEEEGH